MYTLPPFLLHQIEQEREKEHQKSKRQFAFAIVFFEHGYERMYVVRPNYNELKHSMEILIDKTHYLLYQIKVLIKSSM